MSANASCTRKTTFSKCHLLKISTLEFMHLSLHKFANCKLVQLCLDQKVNFFYLVIQIQDHENSPKLDCFSLLLKSLIL